MGKSILIAEDYWPLLRLLELLFSEDGFTVYPAKTCAEALRLAAEKLPDCFLLDYQLDDGDITALCAFIRNHETLKNAPLVIHSTHANKMENCYSTCQADAFIYKGGRPVVALAVVNRLLRRAGHPAAVTPSDLALDPASLRILKNGAPLITLSFEQFKLFSLLFNSSPQYLTAEKLSACVFSDVSYHKLDAIFSLVYRLRLRLGPRYGRRIFCKNKFGWAYIQPRSRAKDPVSKDKAPTLLPK